MVQVDGVGADRVKGKDAASKAVADKDKEKVKVPADRGADQVAAVVDKEEDELAAAAMKVEIEHKTRS